MCPRIKTAASWQTIYIAIGDFFRVTFQQEKLIIWKDKNLYS
jgi:hypothetical protein